MCAGLCVWQVDEGGGWDGKRDAQGGGQEAGWGRALWDRHAMRLGVEEGQELVAVGFLRGVNLDRSVKRLTELRLF